mmetsp:Transcript_35483/g.61410  ORF Transcript_35483/g.61410 Transcript_35483/m.61410 type:complete len:221 (+) Transcript_35483:664-1326(+)
MPAACSSCRPRPRRAPLPRGAAAAWPPARGSRRARRPAPPCRRRPCPRAGRPRCPGTGRPGPPGSARSRICRCPFCSCREVRALADNIPRAGGWPLTSAPAAAAGAGSPGGACARAGPAAAPAPAAGSGARARGRRRRRRRRRRRTPPGPRPCRGRAAVPAVRPAAADPPRCVVFEPRSSRTWPHCNGGELCLCFPPFLLSSNRHHVQYFFGLKNQSDRC